jgi:hypothetical protein
MSTFTMTMTMAARFACALLLLQLMLTGTTTSAFSSIHHSIQLHTDCLVHNIDQYYVPYPVHTQIADQVMTPIIASSVFAW